jgi:hypothetical protein
LQIRGHVPLAPLDPCLDGMWRCCRYQLPHLTSEKASFMKLYLVHFGRAQQFMLGLAIFSLSLTFILKCTDDQCLLDFSTLHICMISI